MFRVSCFLVLLGSGESVLQQSSSASTSLGRIERSTALAGFQSFAEGLAAKYSQDQLPANDPMREQIGIVIEWIDNMTVHLNNAHDIDVGRVGDCSSSKCELNQADVDAILTLQADTISKRDLHKSCRESEVGCIATTSQACVEYDTYRQTDDALLSIQAPCALIHFSNEYIQADEDDAKLNAMEDCLRSTRPWHTKLYDLYFPCKRSPCDKHPPEYPSECLDEQHEFEAKHCESNIKFQQVCIQGYKKCVEDEQASCEDVCSEVAIDVDARKADYEAGQRIKCLLEVLRDESDEAKPDALSACVSKVYDTDHFNLECSLPSVPVSDEIDCDAPLPASSATLNFFQKEYSEAYPFEHVKHCECHECGLGEPAPSC